MFDGESADASMVVAAANTLPFASERRLVVVRGVDRMNAAGQATLAGYAKNPSPSTCLVLVARKIRKDSKLYKAVAQLGGVAEYRAPRKSEYPDWVISEFASRGRALSRDGAAALVRAVGRDLLRLQTEAEKIIAYAGERTDLGRDDVVRVVAETAPVSVFDFLNALGARECTSALELLDDLIADGQELLAIHGMTVRSLRNLISTRAILDRNGSLVDIQREVGMADWQARIAMEQAQRFSAADLAGALRRAAGLEAQMKTGSGDARVLFEIWLVGVCRERS